MGHDEYYEHPHHNVVLRVGSLRIRWLFRYSHDWYLSTHYILPWAMGDLEYRREEALNADVTIHIYGGDHEAWRYLTSQPGIKFFLHGEMGTFPVETPGVRVFGNGGPGATPDCYAPTLICWSPPTSNPKLAKCSAIETGRYSWRNARLAQLMRLIGDVDGYGHHFNNPLDNPHGWNNQKYLALRDHAFAIAIENSIADDYMTEKLTDPLLNETVPIYQGAPNWRDYCISEAVIDCNEMDRVDWQNWQKEYDARRPALLAQKELMRTRFNVFRYFLAIASDPSLLDMKRPITRETPLRRI